MDRLGYSQEHDDTHIHGELVATALCYIEQQALTMPITSNANVPNLWPWPEPSWHPSNDPIRNLEKAGALIAAEIDRLERAKWKTTKPE